MKGICTGDEVVYKADVQPQYQGKKGKTLDFVLENRLVFIKFSDGNVIGAFWDEIELCN